MAYTYNWGVWANHWTFKIPMALGKRWGPRVQSKSVRKCVIV